MPQAKRPAREKYYAWGVAIFLLIAAGLIYGQTLGHPLLHYDDNNFVSDNLHVRSGLTFEGIRWAFCDGPYGEWYPLAPLSHMLDCQLFGTDRPSPNGLGAGGHHLTNLLLHAAASIVLFLVLWRMTSQLWHSALVAALFAVHPQHVESVAWIAERRDVLSGLFFMLTLAAYLGYLRHGRPLWRYIVVAAMLALGLMAKPMLVTVPPLLLLLDFWPLARWGAAGDTPAWTQSSDRPGMLRLVLEKLPLFALAVGDSLMTLRTHAAGHGSWPWPERIGNAAVSCVTYLMQFFLPIDLCAHYPIPTGGWPAWKVVGALAILAAVSAAAVIWRRSLPFFFVGWFWYLGMLAPVLGLIGISNRALMADRYMYLPGIGLYIALAWGAARLATRNREGVWIVGTLAGLAIALLAAGAIWQTSQWRDDATLWRHTLASTENNSYAEAALAKVLLRQGNRDEAAAYFRRAQEHATDAAPFSDLGALLASEGRSDEAIAQFRLGLEKEPDSYLALVNLGGALTRQGQFDEAGECLDHALRVNPRGVSAHVALAHLLASQGQPDRARAQLETAVEIDPFSARAQYELGSTLAQQGHFVEAISHFEAALKVAPNFVLARTRLAGALAQSGQDERAIDEYRRALKFDPNNLVALEGLDKLLRGGAGQRDRPSR